MDTTFLLRHVRRAVLLGRLLIGKAACSQLASNLANPASCNSQWNGMTKSRAIGHVVGRGEILVSLAAYPRRLVASNRHQLHILRKQLGVTNYVRCLA